MESENRKSASRSHLIVDVFRGIVKATATSDSSTDESVSKAVDGYFDDMRRRSGEIMEEFEQRPGVEVMRPDTPRKIL